MKIEKHRQQRIKQRNERVRAFFSALEKKHPQWKLSALLEETAANFPPLSVITVSAIIKQSGYYQNGI